MKKTKIRKAKAARSAKAKSRKSAARKTGKARKILVSQTQIREKSKPMTPMVVTTSSGLGHVFKNEPQVEVRLNGKMVKKTVVHLMKKKSPNDETLVPKISGGKPMKVLCTSDSLAILKDAMPIARARKSGATGISNRDYSKYEFNGQILNKGRLCLAIVRKFVEEKNPTLPEIKSVFSDEVIKPYGQLFLLAEEAKRTNTTSARSRYFSKDEDIVTINGASIALSNQIDAGLTQRMMSVAIGQLNYEIKPSVKA